MHALNSTSPERAPIAAPLEVIAVVSWRYVTIEEAALRTGYTAAAINHKIDKGVWLEGREWVRGEDGCPLIAQEGFERWASSGFSPPLAPPPRPESAGKTDRPTQLYRHFDAAGRLLYVGISLHALHRLAQHRGSPWYAQIARVDIEVHPSRTAALCAEARAIAQERPLFNVRGAP